MIIGAADTDAQRLADTQSMNHGIKTYTLHIEYKANIKRPFWHIMIMWLADSDARQLADTQYTVCSKYI